MSIWTFRGLLLAACLATAACDGGFNVTRNAPERVQLPDGLVVAGPRGWCVDRTTTRATADTAVVVLGSCAAIARNAFAPRPAVPGVVTVSIEGEAGDVPPAVVLEQFFGTDAGRAALARDGRADSVTILETRRSRDTFFIHAEDSGSAQMPGAATDYWRALFDMDGRFVSVSLVGLSNKPIGSADGLATLQAQIDRLKSANPR